jgi:hypothetical protein
LLDCFLSRPGCTSLNVCFYMLNATTCYYLLVLLLS